LNKSEFFLAYTPSLTMARLALCIALIALHYATAFVLPACTLTSKAVAKTTASVRRAATPSELLQPPDRVNINIIEEAEFNFDDINAFPSHMPRPPFHIQVLLARACLQYCSLQPL
jgi:hypothetical protein